jgi:hypothetical protein
VEGSVKMKTLSSCLAKVGMLSTTQMNTSIMTSRMTLSYRRSEGKFVPSKVKLQQYSRVRDGTLVKNSGKRWLQLVTRSRATIQIVNHKS